MNELVRAALVIARRDYVATVWSKTFLLFLVGPLFPILFGVIIGGVGSNLKSDAVRPAVAVIAEAAEGRELQAARAQLAKRLGETALPELKIVAPATDAEAQTRGLLADRDSGIAAVLRGALEDQPLLIAPRRSIAENSERVALIIDQARLARAAGTTPHPVALAEQQVERAAGTESSARLLTARAAQLVLVMLTMILAGMLLSNLIEEKSNKVIEVLAAAVPVDAIFLGKLGAMLAMSLTGIAVWGMTAALAVMLLAPAASASVAAPAIGWPIFAALGVAYFTASYLLLGALFLGIGGHASTVREVQTLSMPITMAQLVVFAFASTAVGDHDGGLAIAASIFPWSSPFAMLARAAQTGEIWPHLLAILWQAMWVALIIRIASRHFRVSVLKSGGTRRGWRFFGAFRRGA
jgi:ABC-2 type transport system permease protein